MQSCICAGSWNWAVGRTKVISFPAQYEEKMELMVEEKNTQYCPEQKSTHGTQNTCQSLTQNSSRLLCYLLTKEVLRANGNTDAHS